MRAWYFDEKPGHQKLPHKAEEVPNQKVYDLGIKHWKIPLEGHKEVIDKIALERDYPNRDVINISKEGLGDVSAASVVLDSLRSRLTGVCVWRRSTTRRWSTSSKSTCTRMRRFDTSSMELDTTISEVRHLFPRDSPFSS